MKIVWRIIIPSILIMGCTEQPMEHFVNNKDEDTFSTPTASESYPDSHEGEWLLTSNLFDSMLTFKRIELSDSSVVYGKKFTFEDNNLKYSDYNPVPTCGNGMFYIDSCNYQMQDKNFTFYFKGGYFLDSGFEYRAKYVMKHRGEKNISFLRTEILNDEKTNFYDQFN